MKTIPSITKSILGKARIKQLIRIMDKIPVTPRPFSMVKRPPRKRLSLLKRVTNIRAIPQTTYVYAHTLACGHVVTRSKEFKKLLGCYQCAHDVGKFTKSLNI